MRPGEKVRRTVSVGGRGEYRPAPARPTGAAASSRKRDRRSIVPANVRSIDTIAEELSSSYLVARFAFRTAVRAYRMDELATSRQRCTATSSDSVQMRGG